MRHTLYSLLMLFMAVLLAGCDALLNMENGNPADDPNAERGRVLTVVDGDTIGVEIDGAERRIRYVGINTPERDEPCYQEATAANARLVEGQIVTLVRDQTDTDRFGRLLRYVYVGDTLVGRELVAGGYAEAVLYEPDDRHYDEYLRLEREAARANRGCHPTGIFDDGSDVR